MPLDANHEGVLVVLDRLDDPAVVPGDGAEIPTQTVNSLVMEGVHPQPALSKNGVQPTVDSQIDPLAREGGAHPRQILGKSVGVGGQRAAVIHVPNMRSAAAEIGRATRTAM